MDTTPRPTSGHATARALVPWMLCLAAVSCSSSGSNQAADKPGHCFELYAGGDGCRFNTPANPLVMEVVFDGTAVGGAARVFTVWYYNLCNDESVKYLSFELLASDSGAPDASFSATMDVPAGPLVGFQEPALKVTFAPISVGEHHVTARVHFSNGYVDTHFTGTAGSAGADAGKCNADAGP